MSPEDWTPLKGPLPRQIQLEPDRSGQPGVQLHRAIFTGVRTELAIALHYHVARRKRVLGYDGAVAEGRGGQGGKENNREKGEEEGDDVPTN